MKLLTAILAITVVVFNPCMACAQQGQNPLAGSGFPDANAKMIPGTGGGSPSAPRFVGSPNVQAKSEIHFNSNVGVIGGGAYVIQGAVRVDLPGPGTFLEIGEVPANHVIQVRVNLVSLFDMATGAEIAVPANTFNTVKEFPDLAAGTKLPWGTSTGEDLIKTYEFAARGDAATRLIEFMKNNSKMIGGARVKMTVKNVDLGPPSSTETTTHEAFINTFVATTGAAVPATAFGYSATNTQTNLAQNNVYIVNFLLFQDLGGNPKFDAQLEGAQQPLNFHAQTRFSRLVTLESRVELDTINLAGGDTSYQPFVDVAWANSETWFTVNDEDGLPTGHRRIVISRQEVTRLSTHADSPQIANMSTAKQQVFAQVPVFGIDDDDTNRLISMAAIGRLKGAAKIQKTEGNPPVITLIDRQSEGVTAIDADAGDNGHP